MKQYIKIKSAILAIVFGFAASTANAAMVFEIAISNTYGPPSTRGRTSTLDFGGATLVAPANQQLTAVGLTFEKPVSGVFDWVLDFNGAPAPFWFQNVSPNGLTIWTSEATALQTVLALSGGLPNAGLNSQGGLLPGLSNRVTHFTAEFSAVPEPSNLLVGGLMVFGLLRRRRAA